MFVTLRVESKTDRLSDYKTWGNVLVKFVIYTSFCDDNDDSALLDMTSVFIRLNTAAFIKFVVIRVRCWFEGGVYTKTALI